MTPVERVIAEARKVGEGVTGSGLDSLNNALSNIIRVQKAVLALDESSPVAEPGGFRISVSLAAKLAAAVVHGDELTGPGGHDFDRMALRTVFEDPEVVAWIKEMGPLAPVKR